MCFFLQYLLKWKLKKFLKHKEKNLPECFCVSSASEPDDLLPKAYGAGPGSVWGCAGRLHWGGLDVDGGCVDFREEQDQVLIRDHPAWL